MSGYRTLHRHREAHPSGDDDNDIALSSPSEPFPVWQARFSPCPQPPLRRSSASSPIRLLTAGADGAVSCYLLVDKEVGGVGDDEPAQTLDATALTMRLTHRLVGRRDRAGCSDGGGGDDDVASIGYGALDAVRNYVGDDVDAGPELAAALTLDGIARIWVRDEQRRTVSKDGTAAASGADDIGGVATPQMVRPCREFRVERAAGTTLSIRPPTLGRYFERDILIAFGCVDGSVALVSTAITGHPRSHDEKDVEKDEGGDDKDGVAGTVVDQIGGGHACVASLVFHPATPNAFAVGRKDGTVDVYGSAVDKLSRPVAGTFRRLHRLVFSSSPVRALSYTPDGGVMLWGDDDGRISVVDASRPSSSMLLVASVVDAHPGSWILDLTASFADSRRFVTCGADRSVKVWSVGELGSGPIHSFDAAHGDFVWSVDVDPTGRRLVSGGDDGLVQIYSCEE